jgi:hypothetical protein
VFINPSFGSSLYDDGRGLWPWAGLPLSRCIHPTRSFSNSLIVWPTGPIRIANLRWALTHEPAPLTPELARQFSWGATTDRLKLRQSRGQAYERDRLGLSSWMNESLGCTMKSAKEQRVTCFEKFLVRAPPVARFNT